MSESPEYAAWRNMRARCSRPAHRQFADYGGRGITVCERWEASFEAFLADMGPRPTRHHTLERENNLLGYEPGNCVWATRVVQARNTRRNRIVKYQGALMPLAEACELASLPYDTVAFRLSEGWDEQRALSEAIWPATKPRRNAIIVHYAGRARPLKEAAELAGLKYATVAARLRAGLPPEQALSVPSGRLAKSKKN